MPVTSNHPSAAGGASAARSSTMMGKLMALIGVLISCLYLANLTAGVIELPDNLPIVGNLDEVFFSGLLFLSMQKLGIPLLPGMGPGRNRLPGRDDRHD